ncbi:MAG: class I SAM-dependent methyltransferase [Kiritimatiellia bacterium]|jgi:ubiquinone/menaquinone biosynthesis C-methylase UbiE|nr:class I SAM-dependent methyltransferase [Kiritimatiellia bacterium]
MSDRYPKSKVEVKGFTARHYDSFMNIVTFGGYPAFIAKSIQLMGIQPQDRIVDFGAGTGRNARLMLKYLSERGELSGIDISEVMIAQFKKRCRLFPNARIINRRIDEPLPFRNEFDKAFISFVLHGFPQDAREIIMGNVFEALRNGGDFYILDWNEFDLNSIPFLQRNFFKRVECPYAFDFIKRDWKQILANHNFDNFQEDYFFKGYVRLLRAKKRD